MKNCGDARFELTYKGMKGQTSISAFQELYRMRYEKKIHEKIPYEAACGTLRKYLGDIRKK